jgi:hypothetical protein
MFQNGTWNRHLPNLAVFDDAFVDENVCSGLSVEAGHRQNLHELIIGAQGVALNQQLQAFVTRIEAHNAELRTRASAVPAASMGGMTIDAFCALQPRLNIDAPLRHNLKIRERLAAGGISAAVSRIQCELKIRPGPCALVNAQGPVE